MYSRTNENIIISKSFGGPDELTGGIGNYLFNKMKLHKDKIAQIDADCDIKQTYEQLLEKCINIAIFLQQKGCKKGDIILHCSSIQINTYIPTIASLFIGLLASFIEMNVSPLTEIEYFFSQLQPKFVLVDPCYLDIVQSIVKKGKYSTEIIVFDINFSASFEKVTAFTPIFINDLKDKAMIFFSSGSTGLPKGVLYSHYNLAQLTKPILDPDLDIERKEYIDSKIKDGKVWLSYDSLYWAVEAVRLVKSIKDGSCRLFSLHFDAHNTWKLIEKYKVNELCLIPYFIAEMCMEGNSDNVDISSLYTVLSVGSRLARKYVDHLQKLLPNVDVLQTYGQSETGLISGFRIDNKLHRKYFKKNPESVGFPKPGVSLRVVDLDTGKNLGPNCQGELLVKTFDMMYGYFKYDSSQNFDENGWWKTGDVVYYDENYGLFVVSRIRDFIIYQGWHISPIVIEEALLMHPAVKSAVVIGKPHDVDDEHPFGFVVLKEGFENVILDDIKQFAENKLPDIYKLRGGIKIIEKLPLTATGKLKRRELNNFLED